MPIAFNEHALLRCYDAGMIKMLRVRFLSAQFHPCNPYTVDTHLPHAEFLQQESSQTE
jgi:hypothetical protein